MNDPVDDIGAIGIGIMSGFSDPVDREAGLFMPAAIVALGAACHIFLTADENGGAVDGIRKIQLHGFGQDLESMAAEGSVSFLISVVGHHHVQHEFSSVFRGGNTVGALLQEKLPGIVSVHGSHPLQKPDLPAGDVAAGERSGVNGDKAAELPGEFLEEGLSHITAHGLSDDDRVCDLFLNKYLMKPSCLISQ